MRVDLDRDQVVTNAADAFVFGFPLVLMAVTRDRHTGGAAPVPTGAPVNRFGHQRRYVDPTTPGIVNPNVDTLHSSAWLDLSAGPLLLSVPDTAGRYYLMPMLDAWTNVFASLGPRTTGTGAARFGIVGPYWRGDLPDGTRRVRSPTNMAWILGRIQADGAHDHAAVHKVQDALRLTPLSGPDRQQPDGRAGSNGAAAPAVSPVDEVSGMSAAEFFGRLGPLLADNPPRAADQPMVDRLAALGVRAGERLDWDGLDEPTREALTAGARRGMATVLAEGRTPHGELRNGWTLSYDLGEYGTYYARRAGVAWVGPGANHAEDALYALSRATPDRQPYSGEHRYVLHFDAGGTPPVRAFWSLTLYDDHQCFVPNPLGRQAIGSRDPLTVNPDGSLDIWVQATSPGREREANWLPAPAGPFTLVLRMYWPERTVLTRAWSPPPVQRANSRRR